ncbi:hypothetical protein L596_007351 [Steinernema carpocapsae]|uniref:Uncharacterized protein n=1 Tax=Steinernema carpocapsae TaxID=34508 RepID=A0A4U5P909_STECR|nr:hypothetical protein L596_007351 [Steinernema carpocapsae]
MRFAFFVIVAFCSGSKTNNVLMYLINNLPVSIYHRDLWVPCGGKGYIKKNDKCSIAEMQVEFETSRGFSNESTQEMDPELTGMTRFYNFDAFLTSMQSRAEFRRVFISDNHCPANRDHPVVENKSFYFEHELNFPFEVPCLSCYRYFDQQGYLSDYLLSFERRDKVDLFQNNRMKPLWDTLKELYSKEQRKGLAALRRGRPLDISESDRLKMLDSVGDGRLLVSPSAYEDLNAFSSRCAVSIGGQLRPLDTIVTATYLTRDPTSKVNSASRHKLDEYKYVTRDNAHKEDLRVLKNDTLKFSLEWADWGCCTACCCPIGKCNSGHSCSAIRSYRTRVGYISVTKKNESMVIDGRGGSILKGKTRTFLNQLFRSYPYSHRGIPYFSSILSKGVREELREDYKRVHSHHPTFDDEALIYYQIEECDESMKFNCIEVDRCRKKKEDAMFKAAPNRGFLKSATSDLSCRNISFRMLRIDVAGQNNFSVNLNHSYMVDFNSRRFQNVKNVEWMKDGDKNKIAHFDGSKACAVQTIAVHSNLRSLIINNISEVEFNSLRGKILANRQTGDEIQQ